MIVAKTGTVVNHCWDNPLILNYAKEILKKFIKDNLLKAIARNALRNLAPSFIIAPVAL